MIDVNEYLNKGYNIDQINQMLIGEKKKYDLTQINNEVPSNMFREFISLMNKNFYCDELTSENLTTIYKSINNGLDLTKITPEIINMDKNLSITFKTIMFCDKFNIPIERMYSLNMTKTKRDYICTSGNKELLKINRYPIEMIDKIAESKIDLDIFTKQNFTQEQLDFIIYCNKKGCLYNEILNDKLSEEIMKAITYLKRKEFKLPKKYFQAHSSDYLTELYNIISIYGDITSNKTEKIEFDVMLQDAITKDYDIALIYAFCQKDFNNDSNRKDDYIIDLYNKKQDGLIEIAFLYYNGVEKDEIQEYINKKLYNNEEINGEIRHNIRYMKKTIRTFLKDDYINFNEEQKKAIRHGLFYGIDITDYCSHEFSEEQLNYIIDCLIEKKDVSKILDPKMSIKDMEITLFYTNKKMPFPDKDNYEKEYMKDKNHDFQIFLDIYKECFNNKSYRRDSDAVIALIDICVKYNKDHDYQIDIKKILENTSIIYNLEYLVEDLNKGYDVNILYDPIYNYEQRHELMIGNEQGIDITKYADPKLSPQEMKKIRLSLSNRNIKSLDDVIKDLEQTTEETYIDTASFDNDIFEI